MKNKLAKLKYMPNNFEIIENGDHVICAVSGKEIKLEKLSYWNVELQQAYYSYVEASKKDNNLNIIISIYYVSRSTVLDSIVFYVLTNYLVFE